MRLQTQHIILISFFVCNGQKKVKISKNISIVSFEYTNVIMNGGTIFGYDITVNSNKRFYVLNQKRKKVPRFYTSIAM